MYIAILGRQAALGLAELERLHGDVRLYAPHVAHLASEPNIQRLGGSLKAGKVVFKVSSKNWPRVHNKIIQHYTEAWRTSEQKVTLGISVYNLNVSPRELGRTSLILKKNLKSHGVSLRSIPNSTPALNTATSHHNKLGLSPHKVELLVVGGNDDSVLVTESTGAQNITALAARDQGRPKRDAFVGMLPPKLAQIMINLATPQLSADTDTSHETRRTLLDPFCGTGVLLQEAMLLGYDAYGTDLSEKMVEFSQINLEWAVTSLRARTQFQVAHGDAMDTTWRTPIDTVACESYLGQPFSAPPSPAKLREVRGNCNHIISEFLSNITPQLRPGTPLCVAVPAWRDRDGSFTHLPLTRELEQYGLRRVPLKTVRHSDLLYYREDQVVARELLVLEKI